MTEKRDRVGSGGDRRADCGSFIVDRRGTILGFDQGMESLTGWPAVEVVGHSKDLARSLASAEKGDIRILTLPLYEGTIPIPLRSVRLELRLRCRDGRTLDVEAMARRLPGPGDRVTVNVLRVVARSASLTPLRELDRRDPLTGLADRDAFGARLSDDFRAAMISGHPVALVLADVDRLRNINDRLGRTAGDEVLRRLAGILRTAVRDEDLVARLGDDDFAVLLPGSGRGDARQVAARLRSAVERYQFFTTPEGEEPVRVTLSLGAASYPADAENEGILMERARDALNEAREMGRNRVWCYVRRPRVPIRVPVYFDGVESLLVGFTMDISPSGIFVQTPAPIDIGMRCALAFPLPGYEGRVHVIGRVVRAAPASQSETPAEKRPVGMGIEFERFGPEDRRAIESFLHLHESSSRRPENGVLSV